MSRTSTVCHAGAVSAVVLLTVLTAEAHHSADTLSVASPKCSWIAGGSTRDFTNLDAFCAQSVPTHLRVQGATAIRERLWIEVSPDLEVALRVDGAAAESLLQEWLERWRAVSGYKTAFVTLLRDHVVVAKAETTMAGDAVTVR